MNEIRSKAQAEQNEAYQRYISARDRYNKILERLRVGEVELVTLIDLTTGLPDSPVQEKPVTTTSRVNAQRFFAYSRTGRRENDGLAVHDITVSRGIGLPTVYEQTCTCPGYKNHGYCWASTEATEQARSNGARKSGTNGVWKRT